ncbi:MAG: ABC transporter [Clostridiales bacterium]|nr:MAG: ABC transporter [Clostridiales bacterium]
MKKLIIENVGVVLDNTEIIKDISLFVKKGEFVGLLGPNGSGKSTLLKTIYREYDKTSGKIYIDSEDIDVKTNKELARKTAVVSQEFDYGFEFSVEEIVMMGRYPSKAFYENEDENDRKIIFDALDKVGMSSFIDRNFLTLSGGEKQRVLIARALAQQTELIIMDEPTNHLDIGYQLLTLDLIKSLDKTVIMALHDLNMALAYCDRVYLLNNGTINTFGTPREVITADRINNIYNTRVAMEYSEILNADHVIFLPKNNIQKNI